MTSVQPSPDTEDDTAPPGADPAEVKIWGTKGVHFWAFLASVLIKARPTSLLELGSGRSTTFLADYAFRARVPCVSIEQDEVWRRKAVNDLHFMNVRGVHVHHVPIAATEDGPWYDMARMRTLLGPRNFDLVFVDGPQGGARRNAAGQALVAGAARRARMIIVDDVHRDYNLDSFDGLTRRFSSSNRFFYRYAGNVLAIASDEWADLLKATFEFLELPYTTTPPTDAKTRGDTLD